MRFGSSKKSQAITRLLNARPSKKYRKKVLVAIVAFAALFSLMYDEEMLKAVASRALSISLGDGKCEWKAAIQWWDNAFPTDGSFQKTIIAGYPSGDKRLAFLQLEGLTGLSARDEWDFKFLGMTNQPFIKANYPHHEGIWGWEDVAEQVILVVSSLQKSVIEYHDILWDIGYAQTFEEAYERIENLYKDEMDGIPHENPPVEDFLVWRDLRVFDEIHWYSWFMDYYMEGGLQRDMFNHELTVPGQWQMAILPNYFTKHEMRHGRFVNENETVTPSYDPMCATLSKGCYPVLVIDPAKLVEPGHGPIENRKMGQLMNESYGFEDWTVDEDAWECIWDELINGGKGLKTFRDRIGLAYDDYQYSFELKNEMYHEINRLIEKYENQTDQVAIDFVNILRGHRDDLGVDEPADPLGYEELMGYHLAFPPFFPNQKIYKADDDFFVRQNEMFLNQTAQNIESIIVRRRKWFEEEMLKKRQRKVTIKYYDATGWRDLPAGRGIRALDPYAIDYTYKIDYDEATGEFATSGRSNFVGAWFSGHLYIDETINVICITCDDGCHLYMNDELVVDNGGMHGQKKKCGPISQGVWKLDLEFYEAGGHASLILEFGINENRLRLVPPRQWASPDSVRKYRELMRLNDLLEEDLRTLKETDLMGPTTRAEWNRRQALKAQAGMTDTAEERLLGKGPKFEDFSSFDDITKRSKAEQLRIARHVFGA